jgi:hypothetical protein
MLAFLEFVAKETDAFDSLETSLPLKNCTLHFPRQEEIEQANQSHTFFCEDIIYVQKISMSKLQNFKIHAFLLQFYSLPRFFMIEIAIDKATELFLS